MADSKLQLTQVKSPNGSNQKQRETLRTLGPRPDRHAAPSARTTPVVRGPARARSAIS